MEYKEQITAYYSQTGHPMFQEDTWSSRSVIENEKDLLNACKNWHKQSASNFNDYPYGGLFCFENITFFKQNIIIGDSGEVFYGKEQECEPPVFYEKTKAEFKVWLNNIKERLPKLEKARKERLKEESEREMLEKLSLKYGKQN